jgi:hypothetical protein
MGIRIAARSMEEESKIASEGCRENRPGEKEGGSGRQKERPLVFWNGTWRQKGAERKMEENGVNHGHIN